MGNACCSGDKDEMNRSSIAPINGKRALYNMTNEDNSMSFKSAGTPGEMGKKRKNRKKISKKPAPPTLLASKQELKAKDEKIFSNPFL